MTDTYSRNFLRVQLALLVYYFIAMVGFRSKFLSLYGVKVKESHLAVAIGLLVVRVFFSSPFFLARATCAGVARGGNSALE